MSPCEPARPSRRDAYVRSRWRPALASHGAVSVGTASALLLDFMVLDSMAVRVDELGFTPNRTAAVGPNLVLLVNLAGTAWLSTRFLTGHSTHHRLERW